MGKPTKRVLFSLIILTQQLTVHFGQDPINNKKY